MPVTTHSRPLPERSKTFVSRRRIHGRRCCVGHRDLATCHSAEDAREGLVSEDECDVCGIVIDSADTRIMFVDGFPILVCPDHRDEELARQAATKLRARHLN
jgi:hypothetical protein